MIQIYEAKCVISWSWVTQNQKIPNTILPDWLQSRSRRFVNAFSHKESPRCKLATKSQLSVETALLRQWLMCFSLPWNTDASMRLTALPYRDDEKQKIKHHNSILADGGWEKDVAFENWLERLSLLRSRIRFYEFLIAVLVKKEQQRLC